MKTLTAYVALLSIPLLVGPAATAPITVHFSGQITGTADISFRLGARMAGYFTYEPQLPPGLQSADPP